MHMHGVFYILPRKFFYIDVCFIGTAKRLSKVLKPATFYTETGGTSG